MNEAFAEGLVLKERHEVIEDDDWLTSLRDATDNEDLMLYWHTERKVHVLALWLTREAEDGYDSVMELELFENGHPETGNDWAFEPLVARLAPVEAEKGAYREQLRAHRAQEAEQAERDLEARERAIAHHKRQGEDDMVHAIEIGAVPIAAPSEEDDDTLGPRKIIADLGG